MFLRYVSNLHKPTKRFGRLYDELIQNIIEGKNISNKKDNSFKLENLDTRKIDKIREEMKMYKGTYNSNLIDWENGKTCFVEHVRSGHVNFLKALISCPGFNFFELDYNLMSIIDHIDSTFSIECKHAHLHYYMRSIIDSDIYKNALHHHSRYHSMNTYSQVFNVVVNGRHYRYPNPYNDAKKSIALQNHFNLEIDDETRIILPKIKHMSRIWNKVFYAKGIPITFENDGILNRLVLDMDYYI